MTVMPLDWCGRVPGLPGRQQHICQNLDFVGIDSPGAMQQSWTVPARLLVRLPADLALARGALAEPDGRRRARRPPRGRRPVSGWWSSAAGRSALLIAVVARHAGAEVLVSEPNAKRREIASRLGLETVDPAGDDVVASSRVDGRRRRRRRLRGLRAAGGLGRGDPRAARSAGAWSWSRSTLSRSPSTCSGSSGASWTLIGARVYERADFERAVELLGERRGPRRRAHLRGRAARARAGRVRDLEGGPAS